MEGVGGGKGEWMDEVVEMVVDEAEVAAVRLRASDGARPVMVIVQGAPLYSRAPLEVGQNLNLMEGMETWGP